MLNGCFTCIMRVCVYVYASVCVTYVKHGEEGIAKECRNMLNGCFSCIMRLSVCVCVCMYVFNGLKETCLTKLLQPV